MYQPILLKYDLSDFEPDISTKTMDVHYNKLYMNYLNKLNTLLSNNNFDFSYPIEDLFKNISSFPIQDRNSILYNAGGVANHELFFRILNPNGVELVPEPLNNALIQKYGSINDFIYEFKEKAKILPGSGYTFLTLSPSKDFLILNVGNQDTPYLFGLIPLMAIDVWEHAYFLDQLHER